jgi:phosphoribosylaminoimidazole-succinocarboxamide synthase
MIVRKLKPLTIECVARGYLIGSGWSVLQEDRRGLRHPPARRPPPGRQAAEPIFTPTTKAPKGQHDEPINDAQGAATIGAALYEQVKATASPSISSATTAPGQAGMILADTKFEFGTDAAGNLFLIDEVLTPDSSRYWPADEYGPDCSPPSYDKQFVRDHLVAIKWNQRRRPAPARRGHQPRTHPAITPAWSARSAPARASLPWTKNGCAICAWPQRAAQPSRRC